MRNLLKGSQCLPRFKKLVTEKSKVPTCFNRQARRLGGAIALLNRAHIQVISENEMTVEAETIPEESLNDIAREAGRKSSLIDARKVQVANHDRIQFRHERGVGNQVMLLQFLDCKFDHRKFVVGICYRPAARREVLRAVQDALPSLPTVEDACVIDDLLVGVSPASPAQGVCGLGVVINVEDRGEVKVDP